MPLLALTCACASSGGSLANARADGCRSGTGASAVYALLACRTLASCRMVGTEIDLYSLESARWNVESNGLGERVGLVQTDAAEAIFPGLALNAAPV